jgi:hypothetical protein
MADAGLEDYLPNRPKLLSSFNLISQGESDEIVLIER